VLVLVPSLPTVFILFLAGGPSLFFNAKIVSTEDDDVTDDVKGEDEVFSNDSVVDVLAISISLDGIDCKSRTKVTDKLMLSSLFSTSIGTDTDTDTGTDTGIGTGTGTGSTRTRIVVGGHRDEFEAVVAVLFCVMCFLTVTVDVFLVLLLVVVELVGVPVLVRVLVPVLVVKALLFFCVWSGDKIRMNDSVSHSQLVVWPTLHIFALFIGGCRKGRSPSELPFTICGVIPKFVSP